MAESGWIDVFSSIDETGQLAPTSTSALVAAKEVRRLKESIASYWILPNASLPPTLVTAAQPHHYSRR